MSTTTARTKRLAAEQALARIIAAARGDANALRIPETKVPLQAQIVQRDGALQVVLTLPSTQAGEGEAPIPHQSLTLTGTLIAHNNGLFYVLTSKGVNVPLKVERYGKALRLLAGHRVRLRGHYVEDGYFDVAEAKIVEEDADDDDQR